MGCLSLRTLGIRTRNWLVLITSDEWAPAWLNWRYGDDYVGWAPLPPDELVESYEVQPAFWMFVPGRYMAPPRVRTYIVPCIGARSFCAQPASSIGPVPSKERGWRLILESRLHSSPA